MAYQTYITEALVCGIRDSNTSDASYLLFTRDAGMLSAHARSVRYEKSKHRYALQASSHIRVTLVRGKGGWRITGTEPIQNLYTLAETREARALVRNTIQLLRRFMHGETVHEDIFDDVILACKSVDTKHPTRIESILSLRTLHALGYIAPSVLYTPFLQGQFPFDQIDELAEETERQCREAIDYALIQSQL